MVISDGYKPIMKPKLVLDYNRGKNSIDIAYISSQVIIYPYVKLASGIKKLRVI